MPTKKRPKTTKLARLRQIGKKDEPASTRRPRGRVTTSPSRGSHTP